MKLHKNQGVLQIFTLYTSTDDKNWAGSRGAIGDSGPGSNGAVTGPYTTWQWTSADANSSLSLYVEHSGQQW